MTLRDRIHSRLRPGARNAAILPAVFIAVAILGLFLVVTRINTSLTIEVAKQLDRLIAAVDANPGTAYPRHFLYLYTLGEFEITVDGKVKDWERVHNLAVTDKKLFVAERGSSWLDSIFFTEDLSVEREELLREFFGTPIEANAISNVYEPERGDLNDLHEQKVINIDEIKIVDTPRVSLRFADGGNNGLLYLLSHIKTSAADNFEYVLYLTVHYNLGNDIFGSTPFKIMTKSMEDGELSILSADDNGPPAYIQGRVHKSGPDWFFELSISKELENRWSSIDAVELQALAEVPQKDEALPPTSMYQIGTRGPLPLKQDFQTYETSKKLLNVTPYYELYHGAYHLDGMRDKSVDPGPHQARLWTLLYGLNFFVSGINSCPERSLDNPWEFDEETLKRRVSCYRFTEEGYRLRVGGTLEKSRPVSAGERREDTPSKPPVIRVFTEREYGIAWGPWPTVLLFLIIVLVSSIAYTAERAHRRTIRRSEESNDAKAAFVGNFNHQTRGAFRGISREIRGLVNDENKSRQVRRFETIEMMISDFGERLERAALILEYEKLVRDSITANKQEKPFDLCKSIAEVVEYFTEFENIEGIEFHDNLKNGDPRPALSATAPADDDTRAQDGFFREAVETILDNAIQYRDPEQNTITITLDVENSFAVLKMFNCAPPISSLVLKRMFDYGSRQDNFRFPKWHKLLRWLKGVLGLNYLHRGAGQSISDAYDDGSGTEPDTGISHRSSVSESSGKKSRRGHRGLGLFLVRQIVEGYDGSCGLDNVLDSNGSGIQVTLRLPVVFESVTQ